MIFHAFCWRTLLYQGNPLRISRQGNPLRISRQGNQSGAHCLLTCCRSTSCRCTCCQLGPFTRRGRVVTEILITWAQLVLSRWWFYCSTFTRIHWQVLSFASIYIIFFSTTLPHCSRYIWNQWIYLKHATYCHNYLIIIDFFTGRFKYFTYIFLYN